jgi:hypothetical protein
MRLIHIDLPEARHGSLDPAEAQARQETPEGMVNLYLILESHFRARHEAHGNVWLADGREATGNRIAEFGGDQFVSDLGRPGRNEVKTIIAHMKVLRMEQPRWLSFEAPIKADHSGNLMSGQVRDSHRNNATYERRAFLFVPSN